MLKFDLEEGVKFESVTPLQFWTRLTDIRAKLKQHAPEWHINYIMPPSPPKTRYYHLCQWDFSNPKKEWPYKFSQAIFAYENKEEQFLLNKLPLVPLTSDPELPL